MELGYNYSLLYDILPALHAPATVQEPCWVWEKKKHSTGSIFFIVLFVSTCRPFHKEREKVRGRPVFWSLYCSWVENKVYVIIWAVGWTVLWIKRWMRHLKKSGLDACIKWNDTATCLYQLLSQWNCKDRKKSNYSDCVYMYCMPDTDFVLHFHSTTIFLFSYTGEELNNVKSSLVQKISSVFINFVLHFWLFVQVENDLF